MSMIEILCSQLSAGSSNVEGNISATNNSAALKKQDFAACMRGLSDLQTHIIYAKYLLDRKSYNKGILVYRSTLYRNKDFKSWLLNSPEGQLSESHFIEVKDKVERSPIMVVLAWNELMGTQRCISCKGVGVFKGDDVEIKCLDCNGRGTIGARMSATLRASELQVSRTAYYEKWAQVFNSYYWEPLVTEELTAIETMTSNWG